MAHLLVDTDILIDYLRGHAGAVRFVTDHVDDMVVSAMSVAELYAGVRGDPEGAESLALASFLDVVHVEPVTRQIARAGGLYRRDYGPSHGVGLADGVIAATAVAADAVLMTLNVRHYPMFDTLEPAYRK